MISSTEAYIFIDTNASILASSGINIDVDKIKESMINGTFTKKIYFRILTMQSLVSFINGLIVLRHENLLT